MDLVERRIAALEAIAWMPLLVLAALAGGAFAGTQVPFLLDLDVHVRFLVALPLLIWAELGVHQLLRASVRSLVERGIIGLKERERFDAIIAASMRWRNSNAAEFILIVVSAGADAVSISSQERLSKARAWSMDATKRV